MERTGVKRCLYGAWQMALRLEGRLPAVLLGHIPGRVGELGTSPAVTRPALLCRRACFGQIWDLGQHVL